MLKEGAESVKFRVGWKDCARNESTEIEIERFVPECGTRSQKVTNLVRSRKDWAVMRHEGAKRVKFNMGCAVMDPCVWRLSLQQ